MLSISVPTSRKDSMSECSSEPPQPTTPSGRFALDVMIGQGASGFVFEAVDKLTSEPVIVKTVPCMDESTEAEARITTSLVHPHIVRGIASECDGDQMYIIMERCEMDSLVYLENNGPVREGFAGTFLLHTAEAIKFLASLQIYHRDIKLENIFMKDGSVKLADFGAALEGTRRSEVAIGSLPYAAPEVYDMLCRKPGAGPYDALAADVWSLGVVLFSLVFGHPPFSRPASNDRRYAVHMASYDPSRAIVTPDAKQTAGSASPSSEAPTMLPELARCSAEMRELLFGLLHPRPHQRMTLDACMTACRQIIALDEQRQAHVPVPELEGLEGARPPSITSPPVEVSMPRAITLTGSWVGRAYAADVWRSPSWHRSPLRGDASVTAMRCTPSHSRRVQSLDWDLPMLSFSQSAPPVDATVPETANAPATTTSVATGPASSVSTNPSLARPHVEDTVPPLSGLTGFVKQPSEVQQRPQRRLSPAISPLRSPKPTMNAPPAASAAWPTANDNAAWQMPMAVCSDRLKRPQRKRRTPKRSPMTKQSPQPQTQQESDACSPNTIENPGACSGIAVTPSSIASTTATDTCARPASCVSDCSTVAMTAKLTLSPKCKAESPSPEPGPAAPLKLQRRPQSPLQLGRA